MSKNEFADYETKREWIFSYFLTLGLHSEALTLGMVFQGVSVRGHCWSHYHLSQPRNKWLTRSQR